MTTSGKVVAASIVVLFIGLGLGLTELNGNVAIVGAVLVVAALLVGGPTLCCMGLRNPKR
jgi:hypothetical protein